jgi:hypothetical protein
VLDPPHRTSDEPLLEPPPHSPGIPVAEAQRADLVAVQADGAGFVVDPRPADVGGRRVVEQVFLVGVLVQPGYGGQPAGDGRAGTSAASRSRANRRTRRNPKSFAAIWRADQFAAEARHQDG